MMDQSPDRKGGAAQNGTMKTLATALGSAGAGVVLASLMKDPAVISRLLDWGPTVLLLLGFGWLADRHVPAFIKSQERIADGQQAMAGTVSRLTDAVRDSLNRDDDVRMAVRTLTDEFRQLREELRETRTGNQLQL